MISRSRGRSTLPIAGAFLVLASLALAPPPAEGGCGHGVTTTIGRSLSELTILRDPAGARSDRTIPGSPGDRPCSGPSCSRREGLPDDPLPTIAPGRELWCLAASVPPRAAADLEGRALAEEAPHPLHSSSVPERPPRGHRPARPS